MLLYWQRKRRYPGLKQIFLLVFTWSFFRKNLLRKGLKSVQSFEPECRGKKFLIEVRKFSKLSERVSEYHLQNLRIRNYLQESDYSTQQQASNSEFTTVRNAREWRLWEWDELHETRRPSFFIFRRSIEKHAAAPPTTATSRQNT
jgi:hypothetical protein